MRPCPTSNGRGVEDDWTHGVTECSTCHGDGINKTIRRERLKYAMELMDPFRQSGYGLAAGDVWDHIDACREEPVNC